MGVKAAAYHAGLDPEHKDRIQAQWKKEDIRIMVATNAFGMGIDKANVRTVIHYELPDSIEAYFQEAGRAGRDGLRAYAIMFYNDSDKRLVKEKIENSFPSIEVIKKVYSGIANYYKLAHGSGINQNFTFDIIAISERTDLKVIDVFNSIKILERSGYFQLSDSLHKPSRLKIKVSQSDLYYFEVANPKFEKVLKTLLRSYSGLFDSYVNINEHLISRRLGIDVKEFMDQLMYLNKIEVIEYLPANDKPQITFLLERLPDDRIRIDYESYGALKERQLKRCDAMLAYVETARCRNIQLLEYFGEQNTKKCGKCDVCLESTSDSAEIELKLRELLIHKKLSFDTILQELKVKNEKIIIDLLRKYADEGLIRKEENDLWAWN
jgi:ATP-dependent DNA helicase RecQ